MTKAQATSSNQVSPPAGSESVALTDSEQLFRAVLEASPDGFIVLKSLRDTTGAIADFVFEYINPVAAKRVNIPQSELLGQRYLQLFPESQTNGYFDRYVAVSETGISTTFESFDESSELSGWFRNTVIKVNDGIAVSFSDITDRKQTELALQQQDLHFRVALKTAKLGSWEHDLVTGILSCSAQCKANFGLPPDAEFTHETLFTALHPDDRPMVKAAIERSLTEHTDYEVEERCYHPDGSLHWLIVRGRLVYDANGVPIRLVGVTLDITPRKLVEETLRQSEERLRIAQQAANAGVWDWDIATNQVVWSAEYYQLYGLEANTFPSYENWLNSIIEQDRDRVNQAARQALTKQIDLDVEFRVHHPTQGERWINAIGQTLLDENGNPKRMTGIALDITHRKQYEKNLQRYQLLLEYSRDIVLHLSQDGRIIEANQAAVQSYGYTRAKLLTLKIADLRRADTLPLFPQQFEQAKHQGILFETIHQRKDGSQFPVEVSAQSAIIDGESVVLSIIRDITERQHSEAALRKSEERFQLISKATNDVMWDCHLITNQMWWSERLQIVFGYAPEQMEPDMSSWVKRVHPQDIDRVHHSYEDSLSSNATLWSDEYRFRRADGSYANVLDRAYILRDSTGKAVRVVGAMADISDRKQVEQELQQTLQTLQESEEWARLAIQVGRLGGWRLHLDSDLVEMDERMREIWGEPEDIVMVSMSRVLDRIHPDDRARVLNAVKAAIDSQSSGIYEIEYRIVWDNGTERWVLAKGQAQFEGQEGSRQAIDFFGTLLDITDRKQAEETVRNSAERLSLALTAAKLGDWSWTATTDIVTFSEQAAAMFGIPPGPFMTWTEIQMLLHPDDRNQARLQVEQAIIERCDYDIEYRVQQPNGSYRWVAAKGRAQYDAYEQVLGMLGVVQDITHRKQAEAEREELLARERTARQEAEQANRIKDEFLAVLSHELRSPLNPILGWTKLLQTRKFNEQDTQRALETIERNAKLQTQLIDDLLDVSRILRGKLALNVAPIDLRTVINAALETVQLSAEAKNIHIQNTTIGHVGFVSGDSGRLQQVIWNLLSNAIKFTAEGGQIEIWLEQIDGEPLLEQGSRRLSQKSENIEEPGHPLTQSSPHAYAQITVHDTGKGISPEFLPYVFEYFRQEDGTTTRKFGGLGLGLAIVRYLTELHGGTVRADSAGEDQGATFTIRLPLQRIERLREEECHGAMSGRAFDRSVMSSAFSPLQGVRVLAVDDEADMRDLIFMILRETGAEIRVAASAIEALEALNSFQPDVLISDIGMPEIDGYQLMHQIRLLPAQYGGRIPAIALTAYAGEYDQQKSQKVGFQRHISKPTEPSILIETICELICKKSRSCQ